MAAAWTFFDACSAAPARSALPESDHLLEPRSVINGGESGGFRAQLEARSSSSLRHIASALIGRWHLVRMAPHRREWQNWLLIKGRDEEALSAFDPDILVGEPESVASRRLVERVREGDEGGQSGPPASRDQRHVRKGTPDRQPRDDQRRGDSTDAGRLHLLPGDCEPQAAGRQRLDARGQVRQLWPAGACYSKSGKVKALMRGWN